MQSLLVIRFGALGDLCLLGWSLAPFAAASRPVTLVTKETFADLMRRFPGVGSVIPLRGRDVPALLRLAGELRSTDADRLVDAHGVLRARLLTLALGRRPDARIAKDTTARLAMLIGRRRSQRLERTMRERFDEILRPFWPESAAGRIAAPPLQGLTRSAEAMGERASLALVPGARWDPKRWPEDHFVEFVRAFRAATDAPLRVFLGPQEARWFAGGPLARALGELENVETIRRRPLTEVAEALAGCRLTLTNDSGLMHLSEAVGTPVVALFGPTVREFGYTPTLPASVVLERSLACRPCSRNGRRACWRRDHACLAELAPSEVLRAVLEGVDWPRWRATPPARGAS